MAVRAEGYEDLVEVGRGGFAVVYRARQPRFDRQVALKVLTVPGLGDEDRRRFEREGLALGRLSWHPNIVVVHDAGVTEEGYPYLAMEFLERGSVADLLERTGALEVTDTLDHGVRLAGALHTAHDAGLLHRDVKPGNALIDAFGTVKLADFGIAAVTGHTMTATGMLTATVAHAAPEVLAGGRASVASDVYSLGSTLYEMLAGRPAFVRDDDESVLPIMLRATNEPVPDLRPHGVPGAVAAVIEAAMAKDPAERPADARALGEALGGAQATIGVPVTPVPVRAPSERPGPPQGPPSESSDPDATVRGPVGPPDRRPESEAEGDDGRQTSVARRVAAGVAAVILLVAVVAVGAAWWLGRDDDTADSTSTTEQDTVPDTADDGTGSTTAASDGTALAEVRQRLVGSWYNTDTDGSQQVLQISRPRLTAANALEFSWYDEASYLCEEQYGTSSPYRATGTLVVGDDGEEILLDGEHFCLFGETNQEPLNAVFGATFRYEPTTDELALLPDPELCWARNPPGPTTC